jgi:hypothetical protein
LNTIRILSFKIIKGEIIALGIVAVIELFEVNLIIFYSFAVLNGD